MAKRKKDYRRQFVSDPETDRLLEGLAENSGGNRSQIIRESIRLCAEQEKMFEAIEADAEFIAMMDRSEADFQAGRYITHEEMKRRVRNAQKRKAS